MSRFFSSRILRYSCLFICFLAACATHKGSVGNADLFPGDPGDSLVARLSRTPCYGVCPVYTVTIYRSGYVLYEGTRNVDKIGTFTTRLSRAELEALGTRAESEGFFTLNDSYRNPYLTDYPTVYIEIRFRGKRKSITHYDANPPASLVHMESYIDALFTAETPWEKRTGSQPE